MNIQTINWEEEKKEGPNWNCTMPLLYNQLLKKIISDSNLSSPSDSIMQPLGVPLCIPTQVGKVQNTVTLYKHREAQIHNKQLILTTQQMLSSVSCIHKELTFIYEGWKDTELGLFYYI